MVEARIVSLNVGRAAPLRHARGEVPSAIRKTAAAGAVALGALGLDGDEQADLRVHGGPDKALCVYPREHAAWWASALGIDLPPGGAGENLSTVGLLEADVVIGDVYRIGAAEGANVGPLVQVSQPRQPCYKLAARHGNPQIAVAVQEAGTTGFYFRRVEAGELRSGDSIALVERPAHGAAAAFAAETGHGRTSLLTLNEADKAAAWNRLRGGCETEWIVFCDADVEPDPEALVSLAESIEGRPEAAVATARLEPDLEGASIVARAAALPHRFDFGVVRGPLYLLRTAALARMPEGLLLEDAWLSAELGARGAGKVLSVWSAVVRYRPAGNLPDYFRERLRTEAGKIQIRADRTHRGIPHTAIARYPWKHFLAELGPREWPLVALNLGVRVVARLVAEFAVWRGHEVSWAPVESSKSASAPTSSSGAK